MLTGKFNGVKPGAACYNSSILAYVRAGRWQDVLSTYEKMKESEVEADPTTFNGVLLASFQVGGRSRVQALVHELVASGAKVGEESCELALEILIPELELNDTTGDRRMKIRTLAESEPSMTHFYLNLNRALRTAELEQSRKTTNIISAQDIAKRRDTAWRNVLRHIVDCVKPVDQAD
jgi:pentatricopeptide repeat protein